MIEKQLISDIVEKQIASTDLFLVELNVSANNVINIMVDSMQGVAIETCIKLSKAIEQHLDRDQEDFELQVSSAGIGHPFKVIQQYHKNIGRQVEVLTTEGKKFIGKLLSVNENGIEVEVEEKVKIEGAKRKQLVTNNYSFLLDQIKSTKDIITF